MEVRSSLLQMRVTFMNKLCDNVRVVTTGDHLTSGESLSDRWSKELTDDRRNTGRQLRPGHVETQLSVIIIDLIQNSRDKHEWHSKIHHEREVPRYVLMEEALGMLGRPHGPFTVFKETGTSGQGRFRMDKVGKDGVRA